MSTRLPTSGIEPLSLIRWLDSDYFSESAEVVRSRKAVCEPSRIFPFVFLHAGCFLVPLVGTSTTAILVAIVLYFVRMFAITGFYHRYFSHKTFETSRWAQFIFAAIGTSAVQRGPLWWAAHHKFHHNHADDPSDVHSPRSGFVWSHIGWLTSASNMPTRYELVHDFAPFPELRFLNRFDWLMPALLFISLFVLGHTLHQLYPHLHTSGWQLVVWGFFISTTVLFHGTCCINSLAHVLGTRRYDTPDASKNNLLLSLFTLGEGWHNNHHKYCRSVRQGFYWWEIDITYYCLLLLSWLGVIRELRPVPSHVYDTQKPSTGQAYRGQKPLTNQACLAQKSDLDEARTRPAAAEGAGQ
jgi:stearoyl-CoA desaturase (delta-9 desaturase)